MRQVRVILVSLVALLIFGSCSQPVSPPSNTVRITWKKAFSSDSLVFTATASLSSNVLVNYYWSVDSVAINNAGTSIKWLFTTAGMHTVRVDVRGVGSTSSICSATDTINISPTGGIVGDTLRSVVVDSPSYVMQPVHLRAILPYMKLHGHYELTWLIDSVTITRKNSDTVSSVFQTIGVHRATAILRDSAGGKVIDSAGTTFNVGYYPLRLSSSSSFAFVLSPITFSALGGLSGSNLTIRWDFGDGTSSTVPSTAQATNSFKTIGNHTIRGYLYQGSQLIGVDSVAVIVAYWPFKISSSTSSTTTLTPVSFSATSGYIGSNYSISWEYGDGASDSVVKALSAVHSFQFAAPCLVRALLYAGSTLLGLDSFVISVVPRSNGYSLAAMSAFKHATAQIFVTDYYFTSGQCILPDKYLFTADSLSWSDNSFSFSQSNSSSGPSYSHTEKTGFRGQIATSQYYLDSLIAFFQTSDASSVSGPDGYDASSSSSTNFVAYSLQLRWFTPDSASFGLIGQGVKNHSSHNWRSTGSVVRYKGGDNNGHECYLTGTDWSSASPMPAVVVTFYK